jgi:ribulose-phosphate 3-epimerase
VRRKIEIAPSVLSADFAHLADAIGIAERAGADLLHLDIMDGHFVPNLTIGPAVVASIRKATRLPLDAHLMVEEPSRYLDSMAQAGVDWISVHAEADRHLHRTLQAIKERRIVAGVAINPATPLSALDEILPDADFILLMSVNPGFGGQGFIPASLKKIRKLKDLLTSYNCRARIEVDGGIGPANLADVLDAGADIVVAGSAVFNAEVPADAALRELRGIAERFAEPPGQ